MTRRSFIRGNLTTSPVMGVLYGLSLFALVAIERAIFDVGLPEQFAALPGWRSEERRVGKGGRWRGAGERDEHTQRQICREKQEAGGQECSTLRASRAAGV